MVGRIDEWINEGTEGWTDRWMGGWMDGKEIDKWILNVEDKGESMILTRFFQKKFCRFEPFYQQSLPSSSFMSGDQGTKGALVYGTEPWCLTHMGPLEHAVGKELIDRSVSQAPPALGCVLHGGAKSDSSCHFSSGYPSLTVLSSLDILSLTHFLCSAIYNAYHWTIHSGLRAYYLEGQWPGSQNTYALASVFGYVK